MSFFSIETEAYIYGIQKDGNNNPVYETAKETLTYRTVLWTLWERERVLMKVKEESEKVVLKLTIGGGPKMVEEQDGQTTFSPTNSSKEHLNTE